MYFSRIDLAALGGPEISRQVVIDPHGGGGPLRRSHLDDVRSRWDGFQLDGPRTGALKESLRRTLVHTAQQNPVIRLRLPDEREHLRVLTEALRRALAPGNKEPAREVLQGVARRWRELDQKRGPKHLEEYRLSVGLRAR
jgi:hypothetical protein